MKSRLNYAKGHPRRCGGTSAKGRRSTASAPFCCWVYFLRQESCLSVRKVRLPPLARRVMAGGSAALAGSHRHRHRKRAAARGTVGGSTAAGAAAGRATAAGTAGGGAAAGALAGGAAQQPVRQEASARGLECGRGISTKVAAGILAGSLRWAEPLAGITTLMEPGGGPPPPVVEVGGPPAGPPALPEVGGTGPSPETRNLGRAGPRRPQSRTRNRSLNPSPTGTRVTPFAVAGGWHRLSATSQSARPHVEQYLR